MSQNTNQRLLDIKGVIVPAVPWLAAASVLVTTPPTPYPAALPKPWGLLRAPRLSRAHRESGNVGNILNKPDTYSFFYLETQYAASAVKPVEEARVYDTFDLVSTAFVTPDGQDSCIPGVQQTWDVSLETKVEGPYVDMGALGVWIGGLILIRLEWRLETPP